MASTERHFDEAERLSALAGYAILDTPREQDFDDIVAIAAQVCRVPIALITLLDDQRQWFKAALGTDDTETPREIAFCAHAIRQHDTMIVEDASKDPRFESNPLVTGETQVRFYAGVPLVDPSGFPLGTLCVLDTAPRIITVEQLKLLEALARQVMTQLELRRLLARKQRDEARHRLIIETAVEYAIMTTDLAGNIDSWSEGASRMFDRRPADALGQPCAILFTAEDVAKGAPAREMADALARGRVVDERWHPRADGELFWGRCEVMSLTGDDGRPHGFLKIMQDRTLQRIAEKTLRESEARVRLALDAAELGAWEAVPGLDEIYGDNRARELLGYRSDEGPMSLEALFGRIHDDDRAHVAAALDAAVANGRFDTEFRVTPAVSEQLRWLRSRAQVFKVPGERHRLVGTVRDISAEKAAEAHRELLNNELQHRVKNTLGVVQGIVNQSLRTVSTPEAARDAITGRLSTLAHAHDLLTQSSWKAAPLSSVIEGAVLVHCAETSRVSVKGPNVDLRARSALALSMALHELFTNAVKYGALSNDTGRVEVTWMIDEGQGDGRRFDLTWREHGGPPISAPTRTGFGTRLIGSSLAGDLGGRGHVDYATDGVRWTLSTTLAAIIDETVSF